SGGPVRAGLAWEAGAGRGDERAGEPAAVVGGDAGGGGLPAGEEPDLRAGVRRGMGGGAHAGRGGAAAAGGVSAGGGASRVDGGDRRGGDGGADELCVEPAEPSAGCGSERAGGAAARSTHPLWSGHAACGP